MDRQNNFQTILIDLSILRYVVKSNVVALHYDINHECENFYRDLLNVLWDCDLKNVNFEKKNAKGVDLVDDEKKIAIQVTSNKLSAKIKDTIKKFEANYSKSEYKLFMLNILSKSHPTTSITYSDGTPYDLKCSIDVDDILYQIENCKAEKISEIKETVENNLGYYKRFLNKDSSLHTFFESSAKPYTSLKGFKEFTSVDSEMIDNLDKLFVDLKSVPREVRKSVWLFLTRCECDGGLEQLYLEPSFFDDFVKEAGIKQDSVCAFVRSEKILYFDDQHIRIFYQSLCCELRRIRGDVLEQILIGPDFSLLDKPLV